jgi:hypothetical protein
LAVNVVDAPLQISGPVALVGAVEARFTVMVNVIGGPGQPAAVGVTVIVPDIGVEPALVAVNDGRLPVPLAAKPMAVLLFVQL